MEENELIPYRKLREEAQAIELIAILKENNIHSDFRKISGDLDSTFQGEISTFKYEVRLKEEDRSSADLVLEKLAFAEVEDVDPSHYLFSYSNDELIDILVKRDEWNEIDYVLSRKILKERGVQIDDEEIKEKYNSYISALSEPKGGQGIWIFLGYLSAIVGGFFGLLIGYMIWQAKTVLPNGSKVPAYNHSTRFHGQIIFFMSCITVVIFFVLKFFTQIMENL